MSNRAYAYDLLHPQLVDILTFQRSKLSSAFGRVVNGHVAEPSIAWREMADDWLVIRDLLGGTRGMRLAGTRYLPQFPKESPAEYAHRLETSFLIDMLDDTIDSMVAKPFAKAVSFRGQVPVWVEELNKNVDGKGTTIHEFAKGLLTDGIRWGKSHIAVDGIGLPTEIPDAPQVRDFEGARPRMRVVPGPNALFWRTEDGITYEVRWYEREVDGMEIVESIHVWNEESLRTHQRRKPDGRVVEVPELARRNLAGKLSVVPYYTKKSGEFSAIPPLMDLAWISVDHWQSYSDQRQILQTARVPMLFKKGFQEDELKKGPTVIGTRRVHSTTNKDADMRYIEPGGTAMNEGREHLKMLVEAAKEKGSQPLHGLGPVTATGEFRADSKATCDLQAWCEALERALRRGYELCASAVPSLEPLPESFEVCIHSEFDLRDRSGAEMTGLRADRARRDISREAYLAEAKRRGLLPEDFDIAKDKIALAKEDAEGMGEDDQGL